MATYRILPESVVQISARSSLHPIEGQTNAVTGETVCEVQDGKIILNPMPTGYLELPIEALQSGHKLQDMEMRRRIDAKKFPTIRYDLREVTGGPDRFTLSGALTFHGVTQAFTEDVDVRIDGTRIYVDGEHTFNIEDFGVKAPKILKLQVYPDVKVTARLVGEASAASSSPW